MQPILGTPALEALAREDLLVSLDFDGTLAPIMPDPSAAAPRPRTRRLVAELARAYPCAVVSSRPDEQLSRLLSGATVWYAVGNQALQPAAEYADRKRWLAALGPSVRERLARAGCTLEDKGGSLALHCPDGATRAGVLSLLESAAAELPAQLEALVVRRGLSSSRLPLASANQRGIHRSWLPATRPSRSTSTARCSTSARSGSTARSSIAGGRRRSIAPGSSTAPAHGNPSTV